MGLPILTVGHSTHPIEEFVALLLGHGVEHLFDVRWAPRSRRNPQFNAEALAASLGQRGIAYTHARALGGMRKPRGDSPNGGWREEWFRGYADHMATAEFASGVAQLAAAAERQTVVAMCAEVAPRQCHRWLLADALTVRGWTVEHILAAGGRQPHEVTSFARVADGRLFYPPPQPDLFSPR